MDRSPSRSSAATAARPSPALRRILLVGRAGFARDLEARTVAASGAECVAVDGLAEAVAALAAERPQLVLVDAQTAWSERAGAELSRLKKPWNGEVPVVLVVADDAPAELLEAAWGAGVDDCLMRPVRLAELRARQAVLERPAEPAPAAGAPRVLLCGAAADEASLAGRLEQAGVQVARLARGEAAPPAGARLDAMVVWSETPILEAARLRRALGREDLRAVLVSSSPAPAGSSDRLTAAWLTRGEASPKALAARLQPLCAAGPGGAGEAAAEGGVPFFCPVEFREWGGARPAEWATGLAGEVSAGGLLVRTLVPVRLKAALELRLHLTTTSERVAATGVVGWARRREAGRGLAGMRVQFLGMPVSRSLARLIEFCRGG